MSAVNRAKSVIAFNPAAVPEIALVAGKVAGGAGHKNLPGGLPFASDAGTDPPGQPRRGFVDAQRIDQVFAAEVIGNQALGAGGLGQGAQGRGQSQQPGDGVERSIFHGKSLGRGSCVSPAIGHGGSLPPDAPRAKRKLAGKGGADELSSRPLVVAQTSKSAVPPISKSARRAKSSPERA